MQYPFQPSDEEQSDSQPYQRSPQYPREVISSSDALFGNFFDPSQPNFSVDMYENRSHGLMHHFTGGMLGAQDSPPPSYNDLFLVNECKEERGGLEGASKQQYVKKEYKSDQQWRAVHKMQFKKEEAKPSKKAQKKSYKKQEDDYDNISSSSKQSKSHDIQKLLKRRDNNRKASKNYRSKQKKMVSQTNFQRDSMLETNRQLREENDDLRRQLHLALQRRESDMEAQLEMLRQENLKKLQNAMSRGASPLELETVILQFQNNSDIDSKARITLYHDNSMNAINHMLPNYAKVIIWAVQNGLWEVKKDRECKRIEQAHDRKRDPEQLHQMKLKDILDIGAMFSEQHKEIQQFRTSIGVKKQMMENAIVKLRSDIKEVVKVACSFKEEIEQMRSLLQPWEVAELLLAVERVKDHPELKLDNIFAIPKQEEHHSALKKGGMSQGSKLLKRRKSDENVEEQVPELQKKEHRAE